MAKSKKEFIIVMVNEFQKSMPPELLKELEQASKDLPKEEFEKLLSKAWEESGMAQTLYDEIDKQATSSGRKDKKDDEDEKD